MFLAVRVNLLKADVHKMSERVWNATDPVGGKMGHNYCSGLEKWGKVRLRS